MINKIFKIILMIILTATLFFPGVAPIYCILLPNTKFPNKGVEEDEVLFIKKM